MSNTLHALLGLTIGALLGFAIANSINEPWQPPDCPPGMQRVTLDSERGAYGWIEFCVEVR